MAKSDAEYLRGFFQALAYDEPLEFDDRRRVPIYDHPELAPADPIRQLRVSIEWSAGSSVHLFSGYRGTGKTTELRRLMHGLNQRGMLTFLADARSYLNLAAPIGINDFLLAFAGAFGDEVGKKLGWDPVKEGYWTRFVHFVRTTKVEFWELGSDTKPAEAIGSGLKAKLKSDLSFRQRLQERLAGHTSELVGHVRQYVRDCLKKIHEQYGPETRVVYILDSIEHIAVPAEKHRDVTTALQNIFTLNAGNLKFEDLDIVYTAPPWLKITSPGIGGLYDGWFLLPCIKVRDLQGAQWDPGIQALIELVTRRESQWERLLGDESRLRELILWSGGYIRDLLQLLRACLRRAPDHPLPLTDDIVEYAVADIQNTYHSGISHDDAFWLDRVHYSHDVEFTNDDHLPQLTRYFDHHLVLCYLNGTEWYDIHPLIWQRVENIATRLRLGHVSYEDQGPAES